MRDALWNFELQSLEWRNERGRSRVDFHQHPFILDSLPFLLKEKKNTQKKKQILARTIHVRDARKSRNYF